MPVIENKRVALKCFVHKRKQAVSNSIETRAEKSERRKKAGKGGKGGFGYAISLLEA